MVIAAGLLVLLGTLAVAGLWLAGRRAEADEATRAQRAEDLYQKEDFGEATAAWQKLQREFPRSLDYGRYAFLAELGAVREAARAARTEATAAHVALNRTLEFLQFHQNNPLLAERRTDLFLALLRLTQDLTGWAERNHEEAFLIAARRAWKVAGKYEAPPSIDRRQIERETTEAFARLDKSLDARGRRARTVAKMKEYVARPSLAHFLAARGLLLEGGYQDDAELSPRLQEILTAIPQGVHFTPTKAPQPAAGEEDRLPSLAVVPRVGGAGVAGVASPITPIVARGVLYALDGADGPLRWARRVGIDTPSLVQRLPADAVTPECLLLAGADAQALLALEAATGQEIWRCRLADPAIGPPLLVGRHALVTTHSGRVEEIELTTGRRTGHYDFGQPLVGGTLQPGSTLAYFAGEQGGFYVLDVAKRQCVSFVLTDHEAGALRGPPQVLDGGAHGYLLLTLVQGTGALELRGYALPIPSVDAKPLEPSVKIAGGADFHPWTQGGLLAVATDAGLLHLFGINQKGQRDPWLFPFMERPYVLEARPAGGRAQIVHGDGRDFWVAAGGRLHRLELVEHPKNGPQWLARWPDPPTVGSPVQAGQAWRSKDQAGAVVVVTQAPTRPTLEAAAFDAQDGTVRWQRLLGATWTGQATRQGTWLGMPAAEGLLFLQGPGLAKSDPVFHDAGRFLALPGQAPEERLVAADLDAWLDLRWARTAEGGQLRWQRLGPETKEPGPWQQAALPAPVAGKPLILKDFLVAPLISGSMVRVERATATVTPGPIWRASGTEDEDPCVGAVVGADEFLSTDGRRALTRWHWPQPKGPPRVKATADMDHRILELAVAAGGKQVAVRDAGDQITLLDAERLDTPHTWQLPGKITAGPFFLGPGLGVVVEGKRLVWLDPGKDRPVWEYSFAAPLVGAPVWAEGMIVVGDQAGAFIALKPATGAPAGPGYTLRANVAPAASPVVLEDGRLLVPLCDGTAVVLPLDHLRAAQPMKQ